MKFQSHVPDCVDADPAIPKQEFKSVADLLDHPWIKGWSEPPKDGFFYCWSKNDGRWSKACLMAQWNEKGKPHWWVLGYMDEIPSELPLWTATA